jgi:hypothetical protein
VKERSTFQSLVKVVKGGGLLALFLFAFIGTVIFFFGGSAYVKRTFFSPPDTPEVEQEEVDARFPDSASIRSSMNYLSISSSPTLEPHLGEDFAFFAWLKFRRPPNDGDEVISIAKLEGSGAASRGYSFGVVQRGGVVRPSLYWRDRDGNGGNFLFSEIQIVPRRWLLLSFGVFQNHIAVVHSAQEGLDGKLREVFHGSYEFEQPILPSCEKDLMLGAGTSGIFRGQIGPFGIFRGMDLQGRWKPVRESLRETPLLLPEDLEAQEIMLFVPDSQDDLSPFQHKIRSRGIADLKKKSKGRKRRD